MKFINKNSGIAEWSFNGTGYEYLKLMNNSVICYIFLIFNEQIETGYDQRNCVSSEDTNMTN